VTDRYAKCRNNSKSAVGFDYDYQGVPCTTPTSARPGSLEKIAVLIERVERGESLHHPDDNKQSASHEDAIKARDYCMRISKKIPNCD